MKGIAPEDIAKARQVDLLTYLQQNDPHELVHIGGNNYTTREHDSLKISNGAWMWFSRGFGGHSALDYLIKVKGIGFVEAVRMINGREVSKKSPVFYCPEKKEQKLLLPDRSSDNNEITRYLFERGIDLKVIRYCIKNDLIYESMPYRNVIFIGYDRYRIPRYASYRATSGKRFLGDAAGSDKHFCFNLMNGEGQTVHVFESAIDLLSYATLMQMDGKDWKNENLMSLSGIYMPRSGGNYKIPAALQRVLSEYKSLNEIHLHLDNDKAGLSSARAISKALEGRYKVINEPPEEGKDYNDRLCFRKHLPVVTNKEKEKEYER